MHYSRYVKGRVETRVKLVGDVDMGYGPKLILSVRTVFIPEAGDFAGCEFDICSDRELQLEPGTTLTATTKGVKVEMHVGVDDEAGSF